MKTLKLITPILLFSLLLTSCKKGEDDPAISLRTRKARVEGNWKMTKGIHSQYVFGSVIETTFTRDSYRQVSTFDGKQIVSEGESFFKINFNKNGAVDIQNLLASAGSYTMSGTWNFTGGVGKLKNKEQLVIVDPQTSVNREVVYSIKELRNKKLVLCRNSNINTNFTYSEEFTFEQ
ncbi:hypothetical protein CNR22_10540 [Sphingobacteriaceae bacterium]|nr:hypothetical protein CNR22_10540 [Sphingobacteriaceae bacterium]